MTFTYDEVHLVASPAIFFENQVQVASFHLDLHFPLDLGHVKVLHGTMDQVLLDPQPPVQNFRAAHVHAPEGATRRSKFVGLSRDELGLCAHLHHHHHRHQVFMAKTPHRRRFKIR